MKFAHCTSAALIALSQGTIAACPSFAQGAAKSAAPSTPFTQIVLKNFAAWDTDHDGTLSSKELDALIVNPKITGDDAAAVATLKMYSHKSKTFTPPTVTVAFLKQYAADPHSRTFPGYDTRFKLVEKRIQDTPNVLFATESAPRLQDIRQGMIGDCFFLSVVGTLVNRDPAAVRKMIVPNADGTLTVTFPAGQKAIVPPITDAESALSANAGGTGRWLATLEAAFGEVLGAERQHEATAGEATLVSDDSLNELSTDVIRTGGSMHVVISDLTGHSCDHVIFRKASVKEIPPAEEELPKLAEVRAGISDAFKNKRLVGTGTTAANRPKGITPNHAYAIVGYDAATDTITLWNPHGQNFTPAGESGIVNGYPTKAGIFTMPLIDFARVFEAVNWETLKPGEKSRTPSSASL